MARRRRGVAWGLAALCCLGLRIPSVGAATSVTFQAATTSDTSTADTSVSFANTTRNFGGAAATPVCPTNLVEARSTLKKRLLVRFNNVSTIPSDAAIKTATLSLFKTAGSVTRTHAAHRVTTAWAEGDKCSANCGTLGATWNNSNLSNCTTAWTTAGGDFNATATSSISVTSTNSVFYNWDIKADVQAWVQGTANNGTLIKDSDETGGVTINHTYAMKENATAANRPKLVVSYLRQVTNLTATAGNNQVILNWTLPTPGADYNGSLIVRKATTAFTANNSTNPVDTTAYIAGNALGDGTVISNDTTSALTFTDTGCANGTTCYYRVFTRDGSVNYSASTVAGADPTYPVVNSTPTNGVSPNPDWSYATGATTLAPPGLTPNGVVVTGSNDSRVHGMSASNGTRSFTPFATGNAVQSRPPVIPASLLISLGVTPAFVTSQDGFAYAIDTANGTQVWKSASLGTALQGGAAVWLQTIKALTFSGGVTDDVAFVTTRNTGDTTTNKVYALNVATGATVWTFNPGNIDGIAGTPTIDYFSNTIWVPSLSNGGTQASLWKLNAANGTLATSISLGDITSSPVASLDGNVNQAPSFIYVGTDAGTLKAIKVSDNTVSTHTPASGTGAIQGFPLSFNFATPSVSVPDTIVFTRTATVHAVSFDGTSFSGPPTAGTWTTTPTGAPATISAPQDNFAGTKVYVGASDGKVHQLRLSDGVDEAQVSIVPGTPTAGDPSFDIDLGRLYVGATDAHIYSFTSPF